MNRTVDKAESLTEMRLDKWLWCARFFKTRALATAAIKARNIRLNDGVPKPSKTVRVGDELLIQKKPYRFDITVLQLSRNRLSAPAAALLYQERQKSIDERRDLAARLSAESGGHTRMRGRPSKRDRRDLMKFKRTEPAHDED